MKPRVTPRWPRFGSNVPLSSPDRAGSDGSHHLSRDVLPADHPSLAAAAGRSETPTERAVDESRWDRLSRSPGQRELQRGA
jgi:hypothetical protein